MALFRALAHTQRRCEFYPLVLILAFSAVLSGDLSANLWDKIQSTLDKDDQQEQTLSNDEVGSGLKEALRVGTETVVGNLGRSGGFNLDPKIHIPLPSQLEKAKDLLGKVSMDSILTDLEDVMAIYKGPDDAATQYFKSKMSAPLATEMKPVVDESLADVGAVETYNSAMETYNELPFVPQVDVDLSDYVVEKGMDGIFYYLAREEAAIRNDPVKRTTDLLKSVFEN